jgi:hypothetical protein
MVLELLFSFSNHFTEFEYIISSLLSGKRDVVTLLVEGVSSEVKQVTSEGGTSTDSSISNGAMPVKEEWERYELYSC